MTDNLVTDLLPGMIPVAAQDHGSSPPQVQVCDQVTLRVTFLVHNKDTGRIVTRFDLDSPYWVDEHDAANGSWSLALPQYELLCFISAIMQAKNMKVILRREEILRGPK